MLNHRFVFPLLLVCSYLTSCTDDKGSSVLELNSPVSTQIDSVDYNGWEYRVDITVNSGAKQSHIIDPTDTDLSVVILGVRPNEQNTIEILWHAVVDGKEVELTMQTQEFFADGASTIDAPHDNERFDFDEDGDSNLLELAMGTCLWEDSGSDTCIHPDSLSVEARNTLLDEDFSRGTDDWWFLIGDSAVESDGEICGMSLASITVNYGRQFGYTAKLPLEANSSYTLSFDARAQKAAEIRVNVSLDESLNFYKVFSINFEVFTGYSPYSYAFETANRDYATSGLVFNLGNGMDNFYCVDNVVLRKIVNE